MDKAYMVNWNDEGYDERINEMIKKHPELMDASKTNPMLDPVMRNDDINSDLKVALWRGKVALDDDINFFLEDYPDGYASRVKE